MKALPALLALLFALTPLVGAATHGVTPPVAVAGADAAPVGSSAGGLGAPTPSSAGAVDPAPPASARGNRTVHVLDISDDSLQRSSIDRQTLDLGPAMGFSTNATKERLTTEAMVERIRSTDRTNRRQQLLLGELNKIEQRTIALRSRRQSAIAAFSRGSIDSKRLLVRLASLSAEAHALETRRERIVELASKTKHFALDSRRVAGIERTLVTFTGPVRDYALAVLRGEAPPTRFYVATESDGVVLSTIQNDTYLRESFRGSLRHPSDKRISPEDALNITADSYPVVWQTSQNSTEVIGSGGSYLVRIPYRGGHLSAFVDSGSERVFKEFQRRPLDRIGTRTPVSNVKDGLRLEINQTYPGAPLHVRLTDARTGAPVDANITVGLAGSDSDFVGTTGVDGSLWTLTPRGRFTVTAIKGNSVTLATLNPAPIPRVNDRRNDTSGAQNASGSQPPPNDTAPRQG
ncbi:MAG: hypothetical protein ABEJ28_01415 [Salinigranum sp.]